MVKGLRMQDHADASRGTPQSLLEHLRPEATAAPESGIVEVMKYGRGREGLAAGCREVRRGEHRRRRNAAGAGDPEASAQGRSASEHAVLI